MRWEYLTLLLEAKVEAHEKELRERFPKEKMSQYSPRALIPELNQYGAEGWELVSCAPYSVGSNADILTHRTGAGVGSTFTYLYFCVFKRQCP